MYMIDLLCNFIQNIIYFVLYFCVYRFSGAHEKPHTDSKHDPTMTHQKNIFTRMLRYFENYLFEQYKKECPYSVYKNCSCRDFYCVHQQEFDKTNELITMPMPSMTLGSDNDTNRRTFLSQTNNKRRPVVIKGLVKDCAACKKWDANFFKENYGQTKLLTLNKTEDFKGAAYTSFTQKLDCGYVSMADSIENMINAADSNVQSVYINNVTKLFNDHPELVDDLELDRLKCIDTAINSESWLKVNMFMGGPGTGSSLHCAVPGNFFFNIYGKKKWILIDPVYSKYMHSTPSKEFSFVISGHDLENLNQFSTHNKFIPKYEIILEPGDVLYIPPWWWHYVHNETDFTIGCAVRDHTIYYQSLLNNPTYMLQSPYIYTLNPFALKIVEFFKGRNYLLQSSMQSDKYVMEDLTGKFQ